MNAAFDYVDHAPLLDLIVGGLWVSIIVGLLAFAAHEIYTTRRLSKKAQRLIQLHAEGDPLSCPGRKQTRTRTQRHLTTPPVTGAASPSREFDDDHSNRPRLGR